jgi:hypothetical protein
MPPNTTSWGWWRQVNIPIARKPGLGRENLATEILAYILRSVEDHVFQDFLERCGITSSPDAAYSVQTQKGEPETRGIFDIKIQRNECERPLVIIESKFDARLTPHQCNDYPQVINKGGLLLFIVPNIRKTEVSKRLSASYSLDGPPYDPCADKSGDAPTTVRGILLGVTSWDNILNTLEQSVNGNSLAVMQQKGIIEILLSDIAQLRRFCKVAEKDEFKPLTPEQINGIDTSTLIHQMTWITRELIDKCIKREKVVPTKRKKDKIGAGCDNFVIYQSESLFYGRNLQLCEIDIWMGFWPLAWEGRSESLLWIELYPKKDPEANRIVKKLRDGEFRAIKDQSSDGWLIPIPITPGKTQYEVVDDAFDFVSRLKLFIESATSGLAAKG